MISEAALTDSITTTSVPAVSSAPTSGSSMNTISPSSLAAYSVMPTANSGAVVSIHSWLVVYLIMGGLLNACRTG